MPRYARRTREVDEAILGTYLSGANSRRIRKALKPLLGEEHLSKSAVSRVVSRLKERFEEWQNRALSEEVYAIVYLDGFHLKVRMAKRVSQRTRCPFHKLELYEIGELPATRMLWSSSCRRFKSRRRLYSGVEV